MTEMEELIRKHFKNGENSYYSREHIRDALIRKGYDPVKVQMVYNMLNLEENSMQKEIVVDNKNPVFSSPILPILGGVLLALIIFFGASILLPNGEDRVTGQAINIISDAKDKTSEGLDQINNINKIIDEKQEQIKSQLDEIHKSDLSIEEKDSIIKEQLKEINAIQQYIEEEQNHLRKSLIDLMDTLSERISGN